jgi:hypothetical protein
MRTSIEKRIQSMDGLVEHDGLAMLLLDALTHRSAHVPSEDILCF